VMRTEVTRPILVAASPLLTSRQLNYMVGNPELIIQFAHYLNKKYEQHGREVSVHASSRVSLNGRHPQEMIMPSVDLASEIRSLAAYQWVLPLKNKGVKSFPLSQI